MNNFSIDLGLAARHAAFAILLWAGFGGLAGCAESLLRDDYMGKSILQPEAVVQPVRRDERGDPILE